MHHDAECADAPPWWPFYMYLPLQIKSLLGLFVFVSVQMLLIILYPRATVFTICGIHTVLSEGNVI